MLEDVIHILDFILCQESSSFFRIKDAIITLSIEHHAWQIIVLFYWINAIE